jgi:hypothetical protein
MIIVQGIREKSPLPEMAFPVFSNINQPGVSAMDFTNRFLQAIISRRDRYQMDMIIHQAVAPYFNSLFAAEMIEDAQIEPLIIFMEKDFLSTIPPLDNMMGTSRHDNSTNATHLIFNLRGRLS